MNPDRMFLPLSNCTPGPTSNILDSANHLSGLYYVPSFVIEMLNDSFIDPTAYYHYRTAHALTYFTRLNNQTEATVRQYMRDSNVLSTWETTGFDVAIHIRHGDKICEMKLTEDVHYSNVLDLVLSLCPENPTVYLASDDPQSYEFFRQRKDIRLFEINNPFRDERSFRSGFYFLADLQASMRSRFTIGTWGSNFDRWLRGLMDVVAERASSPFFEVGIQPCFSSAHCGRLNLSFPRLW